MEKEQVTYKIYFRPKLMGRDKEVSNISKEKSTKKILQFLKPFTKHMDTRDHKRYTTTV